MRLVKAEGGYVRPYLARDVRVCESLVRRGILYSQERFNCGESPLDGLEYRATEMGRRLIVVYTLKGGA